MANTFKSYGVASIGASNTTVYTAPVGTTTTLIGLSLANTLTTNAITVDVIVSKGSGGSGTGSTTDFYVIKGAPIAAGGTLVPVGGDQKIVLEAGNLVKIKSSDAVSVDSLVSVLEIS